MRRSLIVLVISIATVANGQNEIIPFEGKKIHSDSDRPFLMVRSPEELEVIRKLNYDFFIVKNEGQELGAETYEINDEWKLAEDPSLKKSKKFYISTSKSLKKYFGKSELFFDAEREVSLVEGRFKEIRDRLIHLEEVSFIQSADRMPRVESILRSHNLGINAIRRVHESSPHLDGSGLKVSVKENAFDTLDIDIGYRAILDDLSSLIIAFHATDMSTLIAGAGNSSKEGRGVANATNLFSQSFDDLLPATDSYFTVRGVSVQNHSYGVEVENFYGVESAAFDQQSRDLPELLHIFSVGNSGTEQGTGDYEGIERYATITGSFKQAKNVLLVNATDDVGEISEFNSAGPAYDGRVKPELSAYGGGGTSDAAALVSGASLILQESYKNAQGELPPSDLTKAVLIAGANDVGTPGPNFIGGYGQLNLSRSVEILENEWWSQGTFESGMVEFPLMIPSNVSSIQVVLAWRDPPANNGDAVALVNDLDLEVSFDGSIWQPWVLNSAANASTLANPAVTSEDHLNNVEFVTIESPAAGEYTVSISAASLGTTSQDFSLAYYMESADDFRWAYPTKLDPQESGSTINLYFDHSFPTSGVIEYDDLTDNWTEVGAVVADERVLSFQVPEHAGEIVFRAVFGGSEFKSDTLSIHPKIDMEVELLCDEELVVSWNQIASSTGYEVLKYANGTLEQVAQPTDTFAIVDRGEHVSSHFTVRSLFENTFGKSDETVRIDQQGVGCYLNNFVVSANEDESISLETDISLPSRITHLRIIKVDAVDSVLLVDINPTEEFYAFSDMDLEPGRTTYQVQIVTDNLELLSEKAVLFTTDDKKYILFPNPVTDGSLAFLSPVTEAVFQILDTSGRPIREYDITAKFEVFDIDLSKGVYLYRVIKGNKTVKSGRFAVGSGK